MRGVLRSLLCAAFPEEPAPAGQRRGGWGRLTGVLGGPPGLRASLTSHGMLWVVFGAACWKLQPGLHSCAACDLSSAAVQSEGPSSGIICFNLFLP